jgi:hypothetical protein
MTLYLRSQGVDKLVIVGVATDFWLVGRLADRGRDAMQMLLCKRPVCACTR